MSSQWQYMEAREVLDSLKVDPAHGLSSREAEERAARFGPNELKKQPGLPPWLLFLNQFKDFMVMLLVAAALISVALGEYIDAATIAVIIVLNAALGFFQEYRAERSMETLQKLTVPEARVVRDGREQRVPAAALVPGDIVLLAAGDKVPADLRLISVFGLEIEESMLTGESIPVKKTAFALTGAIQNPGDARNMAFMGTSVSRGRGKGVVVRTGMATEMGQICGLIQQAGREETPLQRRLGQLGKSLIAICLAICAVVVLIGVYRGEELYTMFLTGVSLAVAAVPEGLPAVVTVVLAVGVQRMAKKRAVIRRLPAVETLGCATVICADKTGTLTKNEMTVKKIVVGAHELEVTGDGYDPKGEFVGDVRALGSAFDLLMKACALCNNAVLQKSGVSVPGFWRGLLAGHHRANWGVLGDPTEGALLVLAAKAGFWREKLEKDGERVGEIPFDSDRKRMSVIYRGPDGRYTLYVKGAPDVILELSSHVHRGNSVIPLSLAGKEEILNQNSRLAQSALRVLAFAYKTLPGVPDNLNGEELERGLTFLGLAGMMDPPRPSAYKAVRTCRRAGIKVVMITGDHQLTAKAVAQDLGIIGRDGKVLLGREIDGMSEGELEKSVERVSVYARVSPRHKLRIVRAFKRKGHVVAMTGDGVNDAPAVKEADIGIAMGVAGTDVTREASSMILADDDFSTIVNAVGEGRGIYDNIRKFIRYMLSCNAGEVLTMLLASLAGLPLPLLPVQILWMNLVTDGLPALALGVDPYDRDIMMRPPRHPKEGVFSHGLSWRILAAGTFIGLAALAAFRTGLFMGDVVLARTMAFSTIVLTQLFYVFNCRSEYHSVLEIGLFSNLYLAAAVAVSAALQLAVIYVPVLRCAFGTVPLGPVHWLAVLSLAASPSLLGTVFHHAFVQRAKRLVYIPYPRH